MTEDFELLKRDVSIPPAADYCLTVTDGCMLPYIAPGDTVYASCRETLGEMDVGIFSYKGRIVCRQYCEDYAGNIHLLCASPAHESENICIPPDKRAELACLGKVILSKKLPPPVYY